MIMNGFNIGKQYGTLIVQTLGQHTQVRDFCEGLTLKKYFSMEHWILEERIIDLASC